MVRRSPTRHVVKTHDRKGHVVRSYHRGSGTLASVHLPKLTTGYLVPSFRKTLRDGIAGFKIYGVDGKYIRDNIDISFTMGSHGYENTYIPKDEIWIDDELSPYDFEALKIHELVEAKRMHDYNEPYEVAHFRANKAESRWRERFKAKYTPIKHFETNQARELGKFIGINWSSEKFTPETLVKGMNVENEHGSQDPQTDVTHNDPILIAKIAWAHLKEKPTYYDLLEKVEA